MPLLMWESNIILIYREHKVYHNVDVSFTEVSQISGNKNYLKREKSPKVR